MKRRNGYYQINGLWAPSVTTIAKSIGSKEGLINWAAKQGGLGVISGVISPLQRMLKALEQEQYDHAARIAEQLSSITCIQWAEERAVAGLKAESTRTGRFGTNVHTAIECFLTKSNYDIDQLSDNERTALHTVVQFRESVPMPSHLVEHVITSNSKTPGMYGGRVDEVASLTDAAIDKIKPYLMRSSAPPKPGRIVIDYKTGSFYKQSHRVQLGAYAHAMGDITGGLIINVPRETPDTIKCYYFTKKDLKQGFTDFKQYYAAWKAADAPLWFKKQPRVAPTPKKEAA